MCIRDRAYTADARAHMADTETHTAGARALEQQMPSNRGFVLFVFPEVVKIP